MTMPTEQKSLQGWVPRIGGELTLEKVIDMAFDYRGDVTVDKADGSKVSGYLYNRDATAASPFVQLFASDTGQQVTLRYTDIANVRFTGRDTAAGQSYEAWKSRREAKHGDQQND
jgi:hypothetical protein